MREKRANFNDEERKIDNQEAKLRMRERREQQTDAEREDQKQKKQRKDEKVEKDEKGYYGSSFR